MAIYTKVNTFELQELLNHYDVGILSGYVEIAAGIQNTNYFIDTLIGTKQTRFVLTIFESKVDYSELPFFTSLLKYLFENGIKCPQIIANTSGKLINQICGKPCAITSFINGIEIKDIKEIHLEELGKNLASLHLQTMKFSGNRTNQLSLAGYHRLFEKITNHLPNIKSEDLPHKLNFAELTGAIRINLDFLDKNWPNNLPSGVIHADLFPDNVFFMDDKLVGIIDFYFACNDFYIYDVAICINSWCFDDLVNFNRNKMLTLLSAYNEVREFSADEIKALPILLRAASLRFLLTRFHDLLFKPEGSLVISKNPNEYLSKLNTWHNIEELEFVNLGI